MTRPRPHDRHRARTARDRREALLVEYGRALAEQEALWRRNGEVLAQIERGGLWREAGDRDFGDWCLRVLGLGSRERHALLEAGAGLPVDLEALTEAEALRATEDEEHDR